MQVLIAVVTGLIVAAGELTRKERAYRSSVKEYWFSERLKIRSPESFIAREIRGRPDC